jgi:hypothetical protein
MYSQAVSNAIAKTALAMVFKLVEGAQNTRRPDQNGDLFWNRGALTPPKSAAGIVDDANGRHLLRNVQSNKAGHR